ncbi:MAG: hypothetical protein Q9181_006172 [Wetmoreana brouardii]
MYEITGASLSALLSDTEWQFPHSGVTVSLQIPRASAPVPAHYILWAINYIAFSLCVGSRYRDQELTAILKWNGDAVARLQIHRPDHGNAIPAPSTSPAPALSVGESFEITAQYGSTPMSQDEMWLTGIRAMAEAAEAGLDTAAKAIVTSGLRGIKWTLVQEFAPLLRYRHSREAVYRTLAKLARDNRWQDIYIYLKVDGQPMAAGGFVEGWRSASTS